MEKKCALASLPGTRASPHNRLWEHFSGLHAEGGVPEKDLNYKPSGAAALLVQGVQAATHQIALGHLDVRLPASQGKDEAAGVVRNINRMALTTV